MADYSLYRRYCLYKRQNARDLGSATECTWQARQLAEPGIALPATFPHMTELAAAGYVANTDLEGADACELQDYAGLSARQAEAVIAAAAAL